MRKSLCYVIAIVIANIVSLAAMSQVSITGNVLNSSSKESVSAVSVTVKGSSEGTYTDDNGNFKLTVNKKLPITLVVSSVGFDMQEINVTDASQVVNVSFVPNTQLGQEIVVAATRTPAKFIESPVTIERVSTAAIRNATSPNYYDVVGTLKGVDITTSSFAFRTPSTRGFNGSGNLRFNQLVDGMDNQAPALNFSIGSIVGLTELDVDNMELLPGASSALYGSGGMNGTLLINSKDPFKYQGLSFQVKQGVNHYDNYERRAAPFYDWSFRWAKKVCDKFAFKIGAQLVQAQDWQGTDTRNLLRNNVISSLLPGDRSSDPNYDGVNVFGDEASLSMQALALGVRQFVSSSGGNLALTALDGMITGGLTPQQIAIAFGSNPNLAPLAQYLPFLIPTSSVATNPYKNTFGAQSVSRTGYNERDLVNYNSYNVRFEGGMNYKITNKVEASFLGYYGTGTSVYTGADRYSLKNLMMGQYKLELKSKNWFLRGYTTQENSGDSYTATTAALFINNSWKDNTTWFQQYVGTYGAVNLGLVPTGPGTFAPAQPSLVAHASARTTAETGRLLPGTAAYNAAFNKAISTNIGSGGAKFADKSSLYHYEGQYNLSDQIKVVDVIVGASYRHFALNSNGTIFVDTTGKIGINEFGAYLQAQKKFIHDILRLTASIRYDKSTNFEGRFTPRFTALVKVVKDNFIRMSYQTAYRFPSTQDQYINLLTGGANRLIGGLPSFYTFFKFDTNPAYTFQSIVDYRASFGAGAPNPALLKTASITPIKPESMESYELGYKGLITKKLLVDVYGYYSKYKDFIGRTAVGRGKSGNPLGAPTELTNQLATDNYSFVQNSPTPVKAIGWGAGFEYNFWRNLSLSANVFGDQLRDVPAGLVTFYNTPEVRYNLGLASPDFCHGIGFNVNWRWQDNMKWEGTFGTGEVPSYGTLDAQISYKFKAIKSLLKIGGTNVLNKYYRSAFGNPEVGGLYYVGFAYNIY